MISLHRRNKDLEDILTDREFWASWRERLLPVVADIQAEAYRSGVMAGLTLAPVRLKQDERLALDAGEITAATERVLLTYSDSWWRQFEQTTQAAMRDAIMASRIDGSGIDSVIAKLEPLFGTRRASMIASTETTRLYGLGAQATYAAAGLPGWSWQTVNDFRVCPICVGLMGQEFDIGVAFSPAHVSCRCFPRPLVPR